MNAKLRLEPVDFETRRAGVHAEFPGITPYHMALAFHEPNCNEAK